MSKTTLNVENIKCCGCAGGITSAIMKLPKVKDVCVDVEAGTIEITHAEGFDLGSAKKKLLKMGYPETGTLKGVGKGIARAKSYVSCAIGKMGSKK